MIWVKKMILMKRRMKFRTRDYDYIYKIARFYSKKKDNDCLLKTDKIRQKASHRRLDSKDWVRIPTYISYNGGIELRNAVIGTGILKKAPPK